MPNVKIWLEREPCPRCNGTGLIIGENLYDSCAQCGGSGYISLTTLDDAPIMDIVDKIQEVKTKVNQMQADINQISARVDQIWNKVK